MPNMLLFRNRFNLATYADAERHYHNHLRLSYICSPPLFTDSPVRLADSIEVGPAV